MKNQKSSNKQNESSQLMNLFENELRGIYWVEKALNEAIENATSQELSNALKSYLDETKNQQRS